MCGLAASVSATGPPAAARRLLDPARADFYRERGLHVVCPTQQAIAVIQEAIRCAEGAS